MKPEQWARIEELFQAALEQPAELRESWLAAATGDPLVLTNVRALLRADRNHDDRHISDAIAAAAESLRGTITATPGAGARVGPYRLEREIGHGGMGAVWLAVRDDDAYRARVAVKFVRGHLASPDLARRLLAERQILADLTHPNIAWLLDGGSTDDGTPYLVMEYIEGDTIDRWCDTARLDLGERIELFTTVCEAVRYAHSGLVIHRDIKPSNILVTEGGTPKLVDFGIAKLMSSNPESDATLTLRFLTPAYAAPEQLLGGRLTTATDVHGLGGVLYRMVTGSPPHNVSGTSGAELERRICSVEPRPPSRVAGDAGLSWAGRLAGDLDTIILTALHKEPGRRYQSVDRLLDDLRRHQDGLPVLARPDTVGYRAGKFLRRHRGGVGLAAAAAVIGSLALGYHTRRITTERNTARMEASTAREVTAFLRSLFRVADPSVSRGESVTARELLDAGAVRVRTELASQPVVQASMMRTIGEVYGELGLHDRAGPLLESARERHRTLLGERHEETATSTLAYAAWLQDDGRLGEAEPLMLSSLAIRRELFGPDDARVAEAEHLYAYVRESQGEFADAEQHLRTALAIIGAKVPLDSARYAGDLARLGRLLRQLDRFDEAEPLLREALAIQRALYGRMHPDVAGTARNLASLLRDQQRYEEADSLYLESLAIRRALLGDDHPDVMNTLNSYANMLDSWGKRDSAIAVTWDVLARTRRLHNRPHSDLAVSRTNLGFMLRDAGRYQEALAQFDSAIAVLDVVLRPEHPNRAFPLSGLGQTWLKLGRADRALPFLREALRLRRAALPADHRYIAQSALELGTALVASGRRADARPLMEEAYRIYRTEFGDADGRTRRAKQRLDSLLAGGP